MKKLMLLAMLLGAVVGALAAVTEPSDWRYPKMLLIELPKMPFRYFV